MLLILYHYTSREAAVAIFQDGKIAETKLEKTDDAAFGPGVYLTRLSECNPKEKIADNNWGSNLGSKYVKDGRVDCVIQVHLDHSQVRRSLSSRDVWVHPGDLYSSKDKRGSWRLFHFQNTCSTSETEPLILYHYTCRQTAMKYFEEGNISEYKLEKKDAALVGPGVYLTQFRNGFSKQEIASKIWGSTLGPRFVEEGWMDFVFQVHLNHSQVCQSTINRDLWVYPGDLYSSRDQRGSWRLCHFQNSPTQYATVPFVLYHYTSVKKAVAILANDKIAESALAEVDEGPFGRGVYLNKLSHRHSKQEIAANLWGPNLGPGYVRQGRVDCVVQVQLSQFQVSRSHRNNNVWVSPGDLYCNMDNRGSWRLFHFQEKKMNDKNDNGGWCTIL